MSRVVYLVEVDNGEYSMDLRSWIEAVFETSASAEQYLFDQGWYRTHNPETNAPYWIKDEGDARYPITRTACIYRMPVRP